uniref:Serpentine receptor class gamma n=1 Tax=Acrobeloides nanus TaxID=290746 RepID=A0A914ECJ2_9BILA
MVAPITSFLYEWMPESGFFPSLFYFLSTYLMFAAILTPIMLSSNRFTAVVFPVHHKRVCWVEVHPVYYQRQNAHQYQTCKLRIQ